MGLFKRKKDEEAKIQLEREALDKLNGNNVQPFEIPGDSTVNNDITSDWQISGKMKAPHTITAEELNANTKKTNIISAQDHIAEEIPMSEAEESNEESPSNFLYQKMMQSRVKLSDNSIEAAKTESALEKEAEKITNEIPANEPAKPLDITAAIDDIKSIVNSNKDNKEKSSGLNNNEDTIVQASVTEDENTKKTPDAIDNTTSLKSDEVSKESAVLQKEQSDSKDNETPSKNQNDIESTEDISDMGSNAEERRVTLLARCNAFLEDDSGPIKANVEKYKLESVESILKSFETRAAERASKKFSTDQSLFSTTSDVSKASKVTSDSNKSPNITEDTIIFEKTSTNLNTVDTYAEQKNDFDSNKNQAKHLFIADVKSKTSNIEFEDISSTRIISSTNKKADASTQTLPLGKTAVFPIVEPIIDTSNSNENTLNIDNSVKNEEEKNNFEDYTGIADRQKILNSLMKNKKSFILKTILSLLSLISALAISATSLSSKLQPMTINIIDLLICLFIVATNFNVISGISTLFGKKVKTYLPAALAITTATVFSLLNLILKGNFIGFSALAALALLSYNFANKNFYSKTIKNFKLIADENTKNAISIIQNKGATKTIVGKAIDGSALVCYGGEATNIHNFLKYTYCKNPISDKIQKLSIVGVIIGIMLALASVVLNSANLISAIYIFTAAICFTSIPATYHIVSLTVNSANKRLNHYGAMITGYRAADELELCNGIAISSDSLFPDGTIRLVDMKLLSPNPFDQSMLDAAAISAAIHSPLAGIFKQMDTSKMNNTSHQEVDTVIYEEKMGISGWVNDRRVFVGNRDLLIAHGFTGLPPAELDKKIMRKGYFPVYIASDNILCALLIVKYEPDENIIYEIQRLANTGTTILVDNCDPNINEKMLADYFEVYSDTIFVMSKQGSDYYKALTTHKDHRHAGAAYRSRIEGLLATLTASINIKKYISRMTAFYVISVVIGLLALATCLFTSHLSFITPLNILLLQILFTALTLLPTLLRKP